ncbi:FtsX-like permease family protein [Niveibacterium sp. SC-1]|uniref:ABC transporter permease n=1 Tax=Niveibacterium sp. SC-1 TaxID=3135646 RepID=UPI00311EB64D
MKLDLLRWTRFALRNTLRNRRRSLATVLLGGLGAAAILVGGGFALFTYESLQQAAARDTGHLILARAEQFDREEDTPMQYGLGDFAGLKQRLLADPDVRYVLPRIAFTGLVSNGDKSAVMIGSGIDPQAEFTVRGPFLKLKAGKLLDEDSAKGPDILLGEELARSLHAQPGSALTLLASTTAGALNAIDVRVAGVVSSGVPDIDRRLVLSDLHTAQQLLVTDKVSRVGIYLRRLELTDTARARIASEFGGYSLRSWEQEAVFYKAVRGLYDRIFGGMGIVIGLIVVAVVTGAMAMAMVERTREIGTLRALGTSPGQLVKSFAIEGAALGAAGGLLGAVIALAVSVGLDFAGLQMPPPPGRSVGYPLHVTFSPELALATLAAVSLLALLAAALVARRSVRKPIVEALGHV